MGFRQSVVRLRQDWQICAGVGEIKAHVQEHNGLFVVFTVKCFAPKVKPLFRLTLWTYMDTELIRKTRLRTINHIYLFAFVKEI